jgi:hypothetical protein
MADEFPNWDDEREERRKAEERAKQLRQRKFEDDPPDAFRVLPVPPAEGERQRHDYEDEDNKRIPIPDQPLINGADQFADKDHKTLHPSEIIGEPSVAAHRASWRDRFKLILLADITVDDEPLWLIDGLIPAGPSLGVIFGKPKSGKTFLAADMFLHVAMGREYCGCAVQQGAVIYITKEGVRGFQRRMLAMREHHNVGPQVPFYVAYEMPNFGTNSGDAAALVALIRKLVPRGVRIAAIIIDTLARTMPGQSDSDPAVMSQFVENCNVVAAGFGCFVGAVHHSPRSDDTRSRGSNILDAAADAIISVIKDEGTHISTAKIEALKDGEEGLSWRFLITKKRNQKGGFDPLCETLSEPHRNGESETRAKPNMTGEERRFFDILCEAILEAGEIAPASETVPANIKAVTRVYFKKCLVQRGFVDGDKPDSLRAMASKYINRLTGKKLIGADAVYVWLPKP